MRLVALIGNLLIAICLAGVAALFILGGSGTIADNLARLPATALDHPVLFVVGVANLLAPVGIVAALCGWAGGRWWTVGFLLLFCYDTLPSPPKLITWVSLVIMLWCVFTVYALLFHRTRTPPEKAT
jgi:hypothetical protein